MRRINKYCFNGVKYKTTENNESFDNISIYQYDDEFLTYMTEKAETGTIFIEQKNLI